MALKVGIIGNGGIANAHMDGYLALGDEVELVACCDINFPKAEAYAAKYGITTSIENHGFYVQGSERVKRIVLGVNRANFGTTLDVGNFLCADEDPVSATMNNISIATMIHFKDFHIKRSAPPQEGGYIKTFHGNYLRGALTGDGDVDLKRISKIINESGYEGYLSVEFEGWEDPLFGRRSRAWASDRGSSRRRDSSP